MSCRSLNSEAELMKTPTHSERDGLGMCFLFLKSTPSDTELHNRRDSADSRDITIRCVTLHSREVLSEQEPTRRQYPLAEFFSEKSSAASVGPTARGM